MFKLAITILGDKDACDMVSFANVDDAVVFAVDMLTLAMHEGVWMMALLHHGDYEDPSSCHLTTTITTSSNYSGMGRICSMYTGQWHAPSVETKGEDGTYTYHCPTCGTHTW